MPCRIYKLDFQDKNLNLIIIDLEVFTLSAYSLTISPVELGSLINLNIKLIKAFAVGVGINKTFRASRPGL